MSKLLKLSQIAKSKAFKQGLKVAQEKVLPVVMKEVKKRVSKKK